MQAKRVSVSTTVIALGSPGSGTLVIYNAGANEVYLGGSGVTSATGFQLANGQTITITDITGELYGICATSESATLHVLFGAQG